MKSQNSSTSTRKPSQPAKPSTSPVSNRLTSSEIEQLQRDKKASSAFYRKGFAKKA